jgi:hypothetical protein
MDLSEHTPLVFRVHCPSSDRLAELILNLKETPLPRHFDCDIGLCYSAGVVCNHGGIPCTGFPKAVKEYEKYLAELEEKNAI